MKKLSVIMLTYNHERYISKAIQSVLDQKTNFEYELIISNDCSTDKTDEICRKYAEKYPGIIRYIYQEKNLGLIDNEAFVMKMCDGEYTSYLEGDDFYHTNDTLQKRVDFLDSHKEYIAICGNIVVADDKDCIDESGGEFYPDQPQRIFDKADVLDGGQICHTSTLMWRNLRNYLNENQFEAYCKCRAHQDVKITVALGICGSIFYSSEKLGCHRLVLTNDSWTAQNHFKDHSQMVWNFNNEIYMFLRNAFGIDEFNRYKKKQLKCAMGVYKKCLKTLISAENWKHYRNLYPNMFFGKMEFLLFCIRSRYRKSLLE